MRSVSAVFLASLLFVPLLVSCSSSDDDESYVLTEANNGGSIDVKTGDEVEVVLQGNPTTGYEWVNTDVNASILVPAGSTFSADSDAVGAGGEYVFKYSALGPGATTIRFAYQRSWEGRPAQTFSATVNVR